MSDLDVIEDTDIETWLDEDIPPHIKCCVLEKFLCGASYHPELVATEDDDEDACCVKCVDKRYEALCPRDAPTHSHCQLMGGKLCPR